MLSEDYSTTSRASSEVLPESTSEYPTTRRPVTSPQPEPPRSVPTNMAQPLYQSNLPPHLPSPDVGQTSMDGPSPPEEPRPSDDSGLDKGAPQFGTARVRAGSALRDRKQSSASAIEPPRDQRLDFEFPEDAGTHMPPPQRNPSRQQQVTRWGPLPPPSPADYDDWDRPYYPRHPSEYGRPMRTPTMRSAYTGDYWGEDPGYYNRPYNRRMDSLRESDEWRTQAGQRGPPRGPPGGRRRYRDYDDYSDGEEDEQPLRHRKRSRQDDKGGSPPPEIIMRLPFTDWMNRSLKGHLVATIGEFMGTTMFLFFAFAGTQVANVGASTADQTTTNASTGFSPIVLLYISLSFGFSLMVNVWIFFRISGGLFNPAVTLAMVIVKGVGVVRGFLLVGAQLCGAIFSSYIVSVLFPTTFNVRTTLSDGTSLARGVFIEALLTAELVFTIYMLANEKHKATFMAPIGIGLALFVSEMVGVYYTGGSLNPARSFGPCVISGVWDDEHWIYWVGPCTGALLAWGFYRFIKILEYEMANPGQESASKEEAAQEAADMTPTPKKETV